MSAARKYFWIYVAIAAAVIGGAAMVFLLRY